MTYKVAYEVTGYTVEVLTSYTVPAIYVQDLIKRHSDSSRPGGFAKIAVIRAVRSYPSLVCKGAQPIPLGTAKDIVEAVVQDMGYER